MVLPSPALLGKHLPSEVRAGKEEEGGAAAPLLEDGRSAGVPSRGVEVRAPARPHLPGEGPLRHRGDGGHGGEAPRGHGGEGPRGHGGEGLWASVHQL